MRATLAFTLPEDKCEFDAALHGSLALSVLVDIDNKCRDILKYGNPTAEQAALAEAIREIILPELLDM
jgi:hypothetical protein